MGGITVQGFDTPDLFESELMSATSQFWEETGALMADRPFPDNGLVHHYTSIDAAISIIENQELFSSNIAYLNDSNELICAKNVLSHLPGLETRTKHIPDSTEFIKSLIEKIENEYIYASFVASFCDNGDLLGQWRGYGGGVSIAFDGQELDTKFESTSLVKIKYEFGEQQTILDNLIVSALSWLDEHSENADYAYIKSRLTSYIRVAFEHIASKMKNIAFAEENEWRLVTRRSGNLDLIENPEVFFSSKRQRNDSIH